MKLDGHGSKSVVDVFMEACKSNDLALIVNILGDSDLHFLLNVRDPVRD